MTDNDGATNAASQPVTVTAANVAPTAGFSVSTTDLAAAFTDTSVDSDGTVAGWTWDFGDGNTSTQQNPGHTYAAAGTYTVTLTVTDNDGATNAASQPVTVTASGTTPIEVFFDSFENGAWNGLWTEDSQDDWFTSEQRSTSGSSSAEIDGSAADAELISIPIDLQGRTSVRISFKWFIEKRLDAGEYLAFDVSTNGGANWEQKAMLEGNVDQEETWHQMQIDIDGISALRLRFRGKISHKNEDANLDEVRVTAQ